MSYAWRFFYNPRIGLLNYVLGLVGISAPDWLGDLGVVMIQWSSPIFGEALL